MRMEIDAGSGFCFGVKNAIQQAEEALRKEGSLYCLGDIVHNDAEIHRLKKKGMQTIRHEDLSSLNNVTVLIRAHGEPPGTYEIAKQNHIHIIDAPCPIVSKLQNRVKTCFDEILDEKGQIVIYGKSGHPEVKGLTGQTREMAIVVNQSEDLERIDFSRPVYLYAQTTKSKKGFQEIRKLMEKKIRDLGLKTEVHLMAHQTICGQVSSRERQLTKFAKKHDLVVFVSSKNSSNGRTLYEVCKNANPNSYFITAVKDLRKKMFLSADSVGISGATSTPYWYLKKISDRIKEINS